MIIVKGNELSCNGKIYKCAIGKNGFSANKIEGDNCTPIGDYYLREVLFRADKISSPETNLPISKIEINDGWCDAPDDQSYNKIIKLPHPALHEKLWREDDLYNLIIPIGYNDNPPIPGKGSAIFIHLARQNYEGTEGCVALKLADLLEIVKKADINTIISIQDGK